MLAALVILVVLVMVAEVTSRYGNDSRPGLHFWHPRPMDDARLVARLLSRH